MCKHLNCDVREEFLVHDIIFVNEGEASFPRRDLGHPVSTGHYFVRCYDCGMERAFGARRPKWLQRILGREC